MASFNVPSTSKGKVLVVLSDADHFVVNKPDGETSREPTGVFLQELTKPLQQILDAGYDVTFASPTGKGPSIDPLSESTFVAYMGNFISKSRDQKLFDKMSTENNLSSPRPFSSITDQELSTFLGVFIPGGHAPLTDLGENADLGRILLHFHDSQKPTATLCHGPFALLSTKHAPNSAGFAYKGYKMTSWSDAEESLIESLKGGELPAKVESTLANEGAEMISTVGKKLGSITVDRELISGANPMCANSLGTEFVQKLKATA
ncbi:ThiJ/PfpI family protein [Trametopsis cervina]|nr:ThiJ/PfpI family protein [Trametopsis cervina]